MRCSERVRRRGGGQKPAIETQPGILDALNELVEPSIRGDPEAALRWVSLSQRHLSAALAKRGFIAGQKLVGRLLERLNFSLQANCKTREAANHPDRNAQLKHVNAMVKAFQAAGQPVISVDTKKRSLSETSRTAAASCGPRGSRSRSGCMTSPLLNYPRQAVASPSAQWIEPRAAHRIVRTKRGQAKFGRVHFQAKSISVLGEGGGQDPEIWHDFSELSECDG